MYRAVFYYWVEHGKEDVSVHTEIPFVPEIGATVVLFVNGERRIDIIQDVKYIFDEENKFTKLSIGLGDYQ